MAKKISVFMMDLLSTVPYYDAYLCRALGRNGVSATLGAITYYLDRQCFSRLGVHNSPGMLDVVGRLDLPSLVRQPLKLAESIVNTITCRFHFGKCKPDVVHVQFLPLLNRGSLFELRFLRWCQRQGIKIVYTVHDLLPHDTGEAHKRAYVQVYRMVDALICHDEAARERLICEFGVQRERIRVIGHGPFFFDARHPVARDMVYKKLGISSSQPIVLWQGIIRPYKGIDFLLDSWSKVARTRPDAVLVIAGTGSPDELSAIQEKIDLLNLQQSVRLDFHFLSLDEMLGLYQLADMVVYPYRAITTSGALMTGLTQGKPIIATNLPAFRTILRDHYNSLLVEYGDNEGLAGRILALLENTDLACMLARNASALNLGDQAWNDIAFLTKKCYEEVTAEAADEFESVDMASATCGTDR